MTGTIKCMFSFKNVHLMSIFVQIFDFGLEVSLLITVLTILQVLVALGVIAAVLLQSGKSAGLSGSIAGGAETLFGGKKKGLDEFLGKLTKWLAGGFLLLTLILAIF